MTVYWLSFRIAEVRDEHTRRANLIAAAKLNVGANYWEETTSFIVFDTNEDIDTVAQRLKRTIDPTVDLFLIRRMENRTARICGHFTDSDIFDLMVDSAGNTYLVEI